MRWIGLDWDWVTGDCQTDMANHCSRRACRLAGRPIIRSRYGILTPDEAEVARTDSGIERGALPEGVYTGWENRLARVREMLSRVRLARVAFRDCHAEILKFLERGDLVHHIDAHSDEGYLSGDGVHSGHDDPHMHLCCASWRVFARRRGIETVKCVPEDVPDGRYGLFVCLSRPYTPRDLDQHLFQLLIEIRTPIDFLGWG